MALWPGRWLDGRKTRCRRLGDLDRLDALLPHRGELAGVRRGVVRLEASGRKHLKHCENVGVRGVLHPVVREAQRLGDGFGDAATKEKIRAASSATAYDGEGYEEMASIALDAAEKKLDGLAHALLRMALAVRTYAPRLEAHRSLASQAPTCPDGDVESTRAIIYGPSGRHVACKASDVSALVAKAAEQVCTSPQCSDAAPRLLGSETPFSEDSSDVTIELIVDVTAPLFKDWHEACSATEATYFLRHASHLRGSSNQTHLQAFG